MLDSYVYPNTNILKNLANIKNAELLSQMEADYTSSRLSDLVACDSVSLFDYNQLCKIHYMIFQDVYEWAGKIRTINIEKEEPALGGISIEYSNFTTIEKDVETILKAAKGFSWAENSLEKVAILFAEFMSKLWKAHPFRDGNATQRYQLKTA